MGSAVVAMNGHIFYPTVNPDARREFKESADELLGALLSGRNQAAEFFRANPTQENWRAWVRAQAAWRVAFLAEEDRR